MQGTECDFFQCHVNKKVRIYRLEAIAGVVLPRRIADLLADKSGMLKWPVYDTRKQNLDSKFCLFHTKMSVYDLGILKI